ncbi:hypothetical protein BKE30_14475 [Alkanindiges hydrocarboniclasticus]|uniref:Uncharacterized protein n=1 Tax=Alkanindiges hydrocarboniclasticus TaxID=1907941 RepID=A0A1S8CRW2_9GAMM|nr:hypothetical protein [Alkanindiges hydrocarboniclasticus]ONG37416.1 hypothetical protein BKE30_14475 [Alkanindiges hydrocarboniclasticus]
MTKTEILRSWHDKTVKIVTSNMPCFEDVDAMRQEIQSWLDKEGLSLDENDDEFFCIENPDRYWKKPKMPREFTAKICLRPKEVICRYQRNQEIVTAYFPVKNFKIAQEGLCAINGSGGEYTFKLLQESD